MWVEGKLFDRVIGFDPFFCVSQMLDFIKISSLRLKLYTDLTTFSLFSQVGSSNHFFVLFHKNLSRGLPNGILKFSQTTLEMEYFATTHLQNKRIENKNTS